MNAAPSTAAAAALLCLLGGCVGSVDTGQARTCRSVIPALNPSDARFEIGRVVSAGSGDGVRVNYRAEVPGGPSRDRFVE